ncbi:ribosomal protein L10 [Desulfocapsa sulfexigens DSM 10523]|uniref:Large ribosomal subunit protein uL10 n=1 Tax=Desulfocapsa sulfexigens (strain DSM 10523 / SB164P1) TaxID=1167006 RepID=M1PAB4_DESSD|nr:50S ribosomal protein L10 [Desulfocapsa sulfexigens]AGF78582.1 ribosomal protein L10 [Desulfocapsa sulfexigens DSM 10523]
MNRDDKTAIVSALNDSFSRAKFTVVTDYCGLTVSELQELRIQLRGCDSEIRIAKNTLLKRAAADTACDVLSEDFTGTTAIVMGYDDPVAPAKAIVKFVKDHSKMQIRAAALDGEKISADDMVALSKLPSKEAMLGQFLSVLNGVPTGLVQVLSAVPRTFLYGLQAIKEQKEQA